MLETINFLGYTSITNIDISRVVIEQMMERYRDKPTLQWQVFPNNGNANQRK